MRFIGRFKNQNSHWLVKLLQKFYSVQIGESDLKRAEDGHEPIAGDGGEGEDTGHHAHHRVERVQFAEYGWNKFWGDIQC